MFRLPARAVIVVLAVIVPRFRSQFKLPAFVTAALASLISGLRSTGWNVVPRDPPPLCVKVALASKRTLVVNDPPVILSVPPGPTQMSPTTPDGPVMDTDPPSSSRTEQSLAAPTIGLAQLLVDWMVR